MRILFVMRSPDYLRFYTTTIQMLAERGHVVVVAANKLNEKKGVQWEDISGTHANVIISGLVPKRTDIWGPVAKGLRGIIDYARFLHPHFVDAWALRERIQARVLPPLFYFLKRIRTLKRYQVRFLLRFLTTLERAIPSSRVIEEFVKSHRPDILLVTPLVDAASDQVDLVKSAKALGVRAGVCIASWDNLTNKGLIRVEPDMVIVWNEIQKFEAVEFHNISPQKIAVTGAQPFDWWFGRQPTRTRDAFCEVAGLPTDKPFVLFAGSSSFISASGNEVSFVRQWIHSIRESDTSLRDIGVLIRPHPYNWKQWEPADLSEFRDVAIWPRHQYNPMDERSRADYFDSLYYSTAVVGINTSAMVEAAILGRPVHSILAPEFDGRQNDTLHFRYLLPENGGFLRVASSLEEHLRLLSATFPREGTTDQDTLRFVKAFIRPHGIDQPCTPIVVDAIERLGHMSHPSSQGVPLWLFPMRFLLWSMGVAIKTNLHF